MADSSGIFFWIDVWSAVKKAICDIGIEREQCSGERAGNPGGRLS